MVWINDQVWNKNPGHKIWSPTIQSNVSSLMFCFLIQSYVQWILLKFLVLFCVLWVSFYVPTVVTLLRIIKKWSIFFCKIYVLKRFKTRTNTPYSNNVFVLNSMSYFLFTFTTNLQLQNMIDLQSGINLIYDCVNTNLIF